jgi:diguanylate cyclase (GGDEF)-like protein/PAS domain S-box-containing protein
MGLLLRRIALFGLLALPGAPLCLAQSRHGKKPLTTVAAVEKLSHGQAAVGLPVELRGQVTFIDNEWKLLWMQDATGALFAKPGKNSPLLQMGDLIALHGSTAPGEDGTMIVHPVLRVLGHRPLPAPRHVPIAALNTAISQYVEVEGILRPGAFSWNHTTGVLVDGARTAPISIPGGVNPAIARLIGARVRVRGVVALELDSQDHIVGYALDAERLSEIQPIDPNWQPVWQSPPLPIAKLAPPDSSVRFLPAVHLRGTILWNGASSLVLKDGSGSIEVIPAVNQDAAVGAQADVTGFPRLETGVLRIEDANVQVIHPPGDRPRFEATPRSFSEVLHHGHDGDQVVMSGIVLSQSTQGKDDLFIVKDHGRTFRILVDGGSLGHTPFHINPGSILQAQGTLWIVAHRDGSEPSVEVLVESLSSLTVLKPRPIDWRWILAGLAMAAVLAIVFWNRQLRRAVRAQAALIRRQLEHEANLETRYRAIFERNLAAVFSWKPSGEITDCNPAFARMLGFARPRDVIGLSYWSLLLDDSQRRALETHSGNLSGIETSLRRADGSTVYLLENITSVGSGESAHYETTALDITQSRQDRLELRRARDAARREAERDALTGLPNRRYFTKLVQEHLDIASARGRHTGMLYIDLDGFKAVNDTLGHLTGDLLLQEVASRLSSCLRRGDTLCRIGGDEFAILLTRSESLANARSLADRLLDALRRPFVLAQREVVIGAGIGISFFPEPAPDFSTLMQQADSAMYLAKRAGRNHVAVYSPEIGTAIQERNQIESELRAAVARREIAVDYQPQFSGTGEQLVRFEALARWQSPVLGNVSPDRFIPIAEENGLIVELGAQILATACRDAAEWQRKTGRPIPVAVNVSSVQLRSESFVDDVLRTVKQAGFVPELLELEMTESIMLDDVRRCREMLTRLRSHGIRLALDDFGTGYSSLAYLQDLPFDRVKVAPSFLAKVRNGRGGEALIRAVLCVARTLDLSVVIEGIETAKDLQFIRSLGADEFQGFLLGRPDPNPCTVIDAHCQRPAGPAGKSAARAFPILAPRISLGSDPS